jgi:hypothetical protein
VDRMQLPCNAHLVAVKRTPDIGGLRKHAGRSLTSGWQHLGPAPSLVRAAPGWGTIVDQEVSSAQMDHAGGYRDRIAGSAPALTSSVNVATSDRSPT